MDTQLPLTRRTINAYETHHDLFLQEWNRRTYSIPPHLNDWLSHLPKDGLLLDLGCGPGQDTRFLRRQGFRAYGVDLTWSFLQAGKRRSSRLPLVQADMRHLPFSSFEFDGIWAAASVIHLPKSHVRTLFRKLFMLTKPGGWLAFTVMYGREIGVPRQQWIPGRYLAKWYKAELEQAVRAAQWEIVTIERVKNQERKGSWLNLLAKRSRA